MNKKLFISLLMLLIIIPGLSHLNLATAQESSPASVEQTINKISDKALHILDNKYCLLDRMVQRRTEKMLRRMQKKELALQKQLQYKDSTGAKELFKNSQAKYQDLLLQLKSPVDISINTSLKNYIPGIDSMQTSLKFLTMNGANISGIATGKLQNIEALNQQLQQLQGKLQVAGNAQDFLRQREQQLKQQLTQYGMGKQLIGINKQVYYYQQQLAEYKSILNDKEKLEQTLLNTVRTIPAFQIFWQKYSILAQLFPMPGGYGTQQALNGLQTRTDIQNILDRTGANTGANPQYIQQQIQQAQSTLNKLKDKITNLGGTGGNGDMTMPDFKPNNQRTKQFLKRLEYGLNVQNAQSTSFLPTTSNIALTLGYKMSDKATAGIGASYMVGWGKGINHISFSSQGIGLRSFADIKAKGSLWFTGGFEYTYYQQFANFGDIKNLNVWQKSVLAGLTKKYTVGKRKCSMQLLFDALSKQHVPASRPILFRLGYGL